MVRFLAVFVRNEVSILSILVLIGDVFCTLASFELGKKLPSLIKAYTFEIGNEIFGQSINSL